MSDLLQVFRTFFRKLRIPEDTVKGNMLVSLSGQNYIMIENFKGISSYEENEIMIRGRSRNIYVAGKKLVIQSFTKEEIIITGQIDKVEYQNR